MEIRDNKGTLMGSMMLPSRVYNNLVGAKQKTLSHFIYCDVMITVFYW